MNIRPVRQHYSIEKNPRSQLQIDINYSIAFNEVKAKGKLEVTEEILRLINDAFNEAEYLSLDLEENSAPSTFNQPSSQADKPSSQPPYNNGFSDLGGSNQ